MVENTETTHTIIIPFEGKDEPAEEVAFETGKEGWSDYRLEDGTVIKLKNIVSRVLRLLKKKKKDGSPVYVIEGTAVVTTINPEGRTEAVENVDR